MRGVGIVARIQNNRGGLGNTLETPRDHHAAESRFNGLTLHMDGLQFVSGLQHRKSPGRVRDLHFSGKRRTGKRLE